MPVVKEIGIPMVIEACSHPKIRELSGKGGNEWTFRVALDHEIGLTQRVFSRGSLTTAEFLHQVKDNPKIGDGVIEASYWINTLDPEWDKKWTERYKVPPRVHGSLAAITLKWAVVPALEIALKKHGKADRQTIRTALTEVDVKDSPLGPIKFDANHQAWINMLLLEMQDGKVRILEKLPTSPALL